MPQASGVLVAKLYKMLEDEKGDFEPLAATLSIKQFRQNNSLKLACSSIRSNSDAI